jgi:transcriptional regulator with XRE-family HTH domain
MTCFQSPMGRLRRRRKLSQDDVARRLTASGFRCCQNDVSRMERGLIYPRILALGAIADIYGLKLDRAIRLVNLTHEMREMREGMK